VEALFAITEIAIFFQSYTSILFDNIIKIKFPVDCTAETLAEPISFEEEDTIQYTVCWRICCCSIKKAK